MSFIQLEGSLKFGLSAADTEYGSAITAITLQFRRTAIALKPVYSNAEGGEAAGARTRTASIEFYSDPTSAAALSSLLEAAWESDTGELFWSGTPTDDAVSASNPKYSGKLIIKDIDVQFGEVGTGRLQTREYSIKPGTYSKVTS